MPTILIVAALAYLIGSLPAGYIAARMGGVDIRTVGSGNVGATNVTRALGKRFGYPVFLIDFAKGLAAVLVAAILANGAELNSGRLVDLSAATAGVCSVIGHSFPIWLGFKGGKGMATSIGVLFGINWIAALIVCIVWVLVFQIARYVSLASMVAALAFPVSMGAMLFLNQLHTPILFYFSIFLAAIVLIRHRSNLSRLLAGTEPRFARK